MEKKLLLSIEDWQNWYHNTKDDWGGSKYVQSLGDTDTPSEYPCIVIGCANEDDGWGIFCYDFLYKNDVESLF